MAALLPMPPPSSASSPFSFHHHPPPAKPKLVSFSSSPSSSSVVGDISSSPSASVVEGNSSSSSEAEIGQQDELPPKLYPPTGGCKACGREEVQKGCNGEGRIQGGIATVPGFGWWPIKAFRPCPGFVASGGRYKRGGQSMDEVAWGRGDKENTITTTSKKAQSSKQKKSPGRFK